MLRKSATVVQASKRELLIAETKAKINPYAVGEGYSYGRRHLTIGVESCKTSVSTKPAIIIEHFSLAHHA